MPTSAVDPTVDAAIDVAPDGAPDVPVVMDVGADGAPDLPVVMDVAADGGPDRPPDVGMDVPVVDAQPDSQPPPLTVVLSAGTSTAIRGNTGTDTTVYQDACPNNAALIGFHVGTNSSQNQGIEVVSQLQAVCGSLKVSADRTTVQVTPGSALFLRGSVAGPLNDMLCPPDQVVIGFDGHSFQLLDQLAVRCASVSLNGTTVSIGIPTTLPPAGGTGGTAFARTDCPAGQVAVATNIGVSNLISAFGLICATVGVH
ncbi:MAG TPA: hypothetical protein VGL59_17340 [Polyangia bacterium]